MSLSELDSLLDRVYYGLPTSSGQYVNVDTAMQSDVVWACLQARSETVSSLNCLLYRQQPNGGKAQNVNHRLYDLLKNAPNPEMTAKIFWQLVMLHRDTWGNHWSQIVVDDYGARELWPLDPSRCKWQRDPDTRKLYLLYRKTHSETERFEFEEIFHVAGITLDGITGLSPIAYQRQRIGLHLAATEFGARFFGNGSIPGGVLEAKGKMSPEAAKRLKADWERLHSGTSNAHRIAILEEGLTWKQISIPPEDAQFLATVKQSKEDVAAIWRVPPHKIGLLEHTNRASIEEQNIEWVTDTIHPECVRVEQSIQRDLINIGDGKRGVFARFDRRPLLQGNALSRAQVYAIGRQWGYYSADDVREFEDLNPLPDDAGKTYYVPLNMSVVGAGTDDVAPTPESGPGATPKGEDDPPDDVLKPGGIPATKPDGKASLRDLVPLFTNGANGRH